MSLYNKLRSVIFLWFLGVFFILIGQIPLLIFYHGHVSYGEFTFGAFISMFVLPVIYIKYVMRRPLFEFGLQLPNWQKLSGKQWAIFLSIILFFIVFSAFQPDFKQYYVQDVGFWEFVWQTLILSFFYYMAEEFLFRGFLLFALVEKIGQHSFWVVSTLFALFHYGKPPLEIGFAFIIGVIFCYIAYQTRSFVVPFLIHFLAALLLNLLVLI